MMQWLYMTQIDLDRTGNCFGIISQRDSLGLPARIDLVPATDVAVMVRGGELIGYRIKGNVYDVSDVWHEAQYRIPGLEVGLSPVAYASWSMGIYASLDNFLTEFLDNATTPSVVMKNNQRTLNNIQAKDMKDKWRATVQNGDALILGADWDFQPFVAEQTGLNWLQAQQMKVEDIARFFNVPHDLLDIASSGSSGSSKMTYANIGQRNLQFLMMNLAPTIRRREEAFSNYLLPGSASGQSDPRANRYVKFNTDALLQMDQTGQAALFASQIAAGYKTPTEVRELLNLPPLTPEQVKEIAAAKGGMGGPPEPIPNPGAKGLSKRSQREYTPVDGLDPQGGTGGGLTASQDGHCQECCPARALQGSSVIQMGRDSDQQPTAPADMPDSWYQNAPGCTCAAGCPCNPDGTGCMYPPGQCACGCDEDDELATPVYEPKNPNQPAYDGVTPFPGRSADVHIHIHDR